MVVTAENHPDAVGQQSPAACPLAQQWGAGEEATSRTTAGQVAATEGYLAGENLLPTGPALLGLENATT
jgi:hypothetical protein